MIILIFLIIMTGCSQQNSLPNEVEVPLPAHSADGTKWGFEADKTTGKIAYLIIGEGRAKKTYKSGDEINIGGQRYIVQGVSLR